VEPVTRRIAGQKITLIPGVRYRAQRPMIEAGQTVFEVTIVRLDPDGTTTEVTKVGGLTYESGASLLDCFNNGLTSFEGRVW
jgi:hypothetical protein